MCFSYCRCADMHSTGKVYFRDPDVQKCNGKCCLVTASGTGWDLRIRPVGGGWKSGNLEIGELGNFEIWGPGNLGIWRSGDLEIQK